MKRLYYFDKFKLIREAEGDEETDFDTEFDFGGDEAENTDNIDSEDTDEADADVEEEEEPATKEVYNESPEYYVKDVLKTLERKLANLFAEPEIQKDQKKEIDPSSYAAQGLVIDDIDITDMPLNKTLILTYSDTENDFKYKLMISISIDAGIPEKGDINMDSSMVKECGVKFKKYKNETEFIGELDREKVEISSIDQDFLDNLNAELDKKYSVDNGFDIEYSDSENS